MTQKTTETVAAKLEKLKAMLREMDSAVVAFSGGVDSTFLMHVAAEVLGDRALAVTANSETFPKSEREDAAELAKRYSFNHRTIDTSELNIPSFSDNDPQRCCYCKSELFGILKKLAGDEGIEHVLDGTNADENRDYRPGRRALCELSIRSPLLEAGFTKEDIRAASRERGLPTAEKPAFACLASRFPYGEKITAGKLTMVDEAEQAIRDMGFDLVRLRYHGETARIEVAPERIAELIGKKQQVIDCVKRAGFTYVAVDLTGYRTGSMNETLDPEQRAKETGSQD